MEKQIAADLMQEVLKLSSQLNLIANKVEGVTPQSDLLMMRRHIGNMMAACDENLFRPILRQYPELEPHF